MRSRYGFFLIFSVALLATPFAFAHDYGKDLKTTKDILEFCEFYYEEYKLLGKDNLHIQHPQYPNISTCMILYNHIAWNVDHPARDKILISEIEKYLGDSSFVKERHLEEFDSVPYWIKKDAAMWARGENTDNKYAYGIRAMIDASLINLPVKDMSYKHQCNSSRVCVISGDYLKYAISNSEAEMNHVKIHVEQVGDKVNLVYEKTTSESKKTEKLSLDPKTGKLSNRIDKEFNQFLYSVPVPNTLDNGNFELEITDEVIYRFDDHKRNAKILKNSAGNYMEVIDEKTGILLNSHFEKNALFDDWQKVELVDTNIFERKNGIQNELKIPKWWKETTRWYSDGIISDAEYLNAIEYLIGKEILRV